MSNLIDNLKTAGPVIVVVDEADYATPNAAVNKSMKTRINNLIFQMLGTTGQYVGVTATPARLNLNNTFDNQTETWVQFRAHSEYTGQDIFFPQTGSKPYRLVWLPGPGTSAVG